MNRKSRIEAALNEALAPLHLEVVDESHMHSVPAGAESHYRVTIASETFLNMPLIARHRRVNTLLAAEFPSGLHALAIHAWTPEQWFAKGGIAPTSPPCLGGSKAEATERDSGQGPR